MCAQWAFIEHVTDSLAKPRGGDAKAPTLWPSEASAIVQKNGKDQVVGKCRRATFFRYLLENFKFYDKYSIWSPLVEDIKANTKPVDRYLIWIWRQGELYEEFLTEQAKISGIYISSQGAVFIPEYNVSGKKDIEVVNPETKKLSIVESKSVYSFGGNAVLGSPGKRREGALGTPKDNNLMQIALYHWWHASEDDAYEESRLVYGDRGSGRYGEYLVKTETNEEGVINVLWKPHAPQSGPWVTSGITINSILNEYKNQQLWLDGGIIPPRDFEILFSEEQLAELHANDEMTKTDKEQYEKVIARREENKELEASGQKQKKELKQIEKSSFACSYCQFSKVCYNEKNEPRIL